MMEAEMEEKTLEQRIAALEAELKEAKAKEAKAAEPPKPRQPWPKYDPTEGMMMPASAVKPMADLIPTPKPSPGFNAHSWAQTKPGVPGGFGEPPKTGTAKGVKRGSGWVEPTPLSPVPGLKYVDQQIDVADAIDRRELERKLGGR